MFNTRHFSSLLVFLAASFSGFSQSMQWASEVVGFSSEYTGGLPKQFNAIQALGAPNVLPTYGSTANAWAPGGNDNNTAWIQVKFPTPQKIRQIVINENYNAGRISRITLYDVSNANYEVFQNNDPKTPSQPDFFRLILPLTSYKVQSLRVELNTQSQSYQPQIDAIGISDSDAPFRLEISIAPGFENLPAPEHLGSEINTGNDELLPKISPDGKTLFFAREENKLQQIYYAQMNEDESFAEAINIGTPLNRDNGNCCLLSITPDGQNALLLNRYLPNGTMEVGLSMTSKGMEGWQMPVPVEIDDFYNRSSFGEYSLSVDGKTMVMAVQRDDGLGSKDVHVSFLKENNTWTKPLNLGPDINSAESEVGPFLAADGVTLLYSTRGKPGYGNADLFMTKRLDDTWTKWSTPLNLGPVINGTAFDAYYSIPASGHFAYFSKNISGVQGEIFRLDLRKQEQVQPQAEIKSVTEEAIQAMAQSPQKEEPLKEEIKSTTIPVLLVRGIVRDAKTRRPIESQITYKQLETNEEMGVAKSDSRTGEYTIILPFGKNYSLYAEEQGYYSIHDNLSLIGDGNYHELVKDLFLAPIEVGQSVKLNNIFFVRAKAQLLPASFDELNHLLDFMKQYPKAVILIEGHTDNQGSLQLNQALSQDRAMAIKNYLITKGIANLRINVKGWGSSKPVTDNSTEENRQINRRVEFTILRF